MVQTAQLYALEAVGVTSEGAKMLHVQTLRHLRGIFGSARHVDGLSDHAFLSKYDLPDSMHMVRRRSGTLPSRPAVAFATAIETALPEAYVAKSRAEPSKDVAMAFACSQCDLRFGTLHDLKTHEGKAHGIIKARVDVTKNEHGINGMPICRHCGEKFSKWNILSRHVARQGCPALQQGQVDAAVKAMLITEQRPALERPEVVSCIQQKGWAGLLQDKALCAELKQRCAVCYQWIVATNGIRSHIRKEHGTSFLQHEATIKQHQKLWRQAIQSPCQVCGAAVVDRPQHAGSCSVLLQLMYMSLLLVGHCKEGSPLAVTGSGEAGDGTLRQSSASLRGKAGRGGGGTVQRSGQAQKTTNAGRKLQLEQGKGWWERWRKREEEGRQGSAAQGGGSHSVLSDSTACRPGEPHPAGHRLSDDDEEHRSAGMHAPGDVQNQCGVEAHQSRGTTEAGQAAPSHDDGMLAQRAQGQGPQGQGQCGGTKQAA